MYKRLLAIVLALSGFSQVFSQENGQANFQILQLISPARIAALGGNAIAVKDGDLNLGLYVPSLLDSLSSDQIVFGFREAMDAKSMSDFRWVEI
jgi:hypothetical protein